MNLTLRTFLVGSLLGSCGGDPHIQRWEQTQRDSFHGECDLVLLHQDNFDNGDSLDIHIRTTMQDYFSYIEASAIMVGDDVVEFLAGPIVKVNGEATTNEYFPLMLSDDSKNYNIVAVDEKLNGGRPVYVMNLDVVRIVIKYTKKFMTVSVQPLKEHMASLNGAYGLLGEYGTGNMLARNRMDVIEDFIDFGFEWQVNPALDDPVLFTESREPQLPYEKCRMPTGVAQASRRLRAANRALYDAAVEACSAHNEPENVDLCVNDVLLTGDMELASAW